MTDRKTDIRQKMILARQLLIEAAERIDEQSAIASTENPSWTVRDILAHVTGSEQGLLRNVERFLAGGELPAGFSLDVWNQRQVEKRRPMDISAMLANLEASRKEAWTLLDRLSEADMDVPGIHPAGFATTVAGLFLTIANHELDHGNEIRAALGLPVIEIADWRQAFAASGEKA